MTLKPTFIGSLKFAALYGSPFALIGCLVSLVLTGPTAALIAFAAAYVVAAVFFAILIAMGAYRLHLTEAALESRGGLGGPAVTPWADIRLIETDRQFGRELWLKVHLRPGPSGRTEPWMLAAFLYGMSAPELRDLLTSFLGSEPDDRPDALAATHPFEGRLQAVERD